jgi:hypothetical protein
LADALSQIYFDIRTDEIQPEEQVIDMEKDEKWMPPKQHLNQEEFSTNFPDHHLETQRITNLLQRSSIREQTTSIPHVMAMSVPRRPECDIGLHWSLCKLRRGKGPGCPFHYSTAGFATYSEYMDMEVYIRNLEEWDAKYGPSSASNTTEFTNPELVHNEVSGIQKRTQRSRRQMAKRHLKPPSESNETDEDGNPLRIKWITSNESEENSPMERPYFRDTTFRNTRGRTVNKEPLSHVVTRCNVRGRGSLSHYLVYSESPSRWCSLAIILLIYLHHNLLLVSNRSIQNTYRLVILVVFTLLSLSCSLERFAFEYHVNISKTRYP